MLNDLVAGGDGTVMDHRIVAVSIFSANELFWVTIPAGPLRWFVLVACLIEIIV